LEESFMTYKNRRATLRAAAALACATSGVGSLAWAQAESGDPASAVPAQPLPVVQPAAVGAPASASAPTQIEEVVVTATKRKQSVRDVPQSIAVFTGAQLENSGKINLSDFIEETPGVTASEGGPGFTRVSMRGVETDTNPYSGMTSTVGYFIGDTAFTDSYNNSIIPDLSAFDLQSVEVLKGPQATLFGGAALAGAVRYILQEPLLGDWEARAFTQFVDAGSGGGGTALTSGAALNLPLYKDQLAARVDFVRRNYPGTTTDERTGLRDQDYGGGKQVRAIVLWQPIRDLHIKLTHLTQDFYAPNELIVSNYTDRRQSNITTFPIPSKNDFRLDNAEVVYNFSDMRLTALGSSLQKNALFYGDETAALIGTPPANYPPTAAVQSSVADYTKALSAELRLQSTGSGPFKWLVGLYTYNSSSYFNILFDTRLGQSLTGPGSLLGTNPLLLQLFELAGLPSASLQQTTSLLDGISNSKSYERAAFINLDYTLWHRLDLSAGVRLYEAAVGGGYIGSGTLVMLENNLQDSNTESTIKEKGVAPKLSATWHFTPDISLYATAAKGYRFGGINDWPSTASNGVPATYKSDSLWNYELGLRTNWLHNSLHADLTPYYIDYKNPIVGQSTPGAISIGYNNNVGGARAYGVETALLWKTPLPGLSLAASGSLSESHTTQLFRDSSGAVLQPGQEMPGASHLQYNLAATYLRPLLWQVRGGPDIGYTYLGKGWNDINHDVQIDGFGNLRAGWYFERAVYDMKAKLAINASNLLNVTKPTAALTGKAILTQAPVDQYTLTPPREISVRLSLDF
jgi:outer membrane receptor protein involved in Fe transport